ncbi:putative mitochondrial protein [Tanacetum coccineum]
MRSHDHRILLKEGSPKVNTRPYRHSATQKDALKMTPFGLTNAPLTFQSLMNEVFKPFLRKFTLVFVDDILVYSPDMQSRIEHLRLVLQTMRQHHLKASSKYVFGTSQVEYLGPIISDKGVATYPNKIQAMKD